MVEFRMLTVAKVGDWLEASAVKAYLESHDIPVEIPNRPVSGNFTGGVNIGMGVISVTFEGFDIKVPEDSVAKAQELLESFKKAKSRADLAEALRENGSGIDGAAESLLARRSIHQQKFLSSSIFSLLFPIVFTLFGLTHFVRYRNLGGTVSGRTVVGLVLWIIGLVYSITVLWAIFIRVFPYRNTI